MILTPNQSLKELIPNALFCKETQAVNAQPCAWIELSSEAFFHNVAQVKQVIGSGLLASVLKANAYGHGLIEMGRLCDQTADISFICVAFLSEALILRAAGVKKPIIVLGFVDGDIVQSLDANIAFVVDSYEQVFALQAVAQLHKTSIDIHIKIDIGLSRRGLQKDAVTEFVHTIRQLSHIRFVGMCSHFSSSYSDETMTESQAALFASIVQNLGAQGMPILFIHISNSSCTNVSNCNVLRAGIALYGYNPKQLPFSLKPVLSFKTRVVQIRTVPAEVLVGYDGTYRTQRITILAYVPIGYFDGYDIRFSNVGVMYIRGSYAPVRGRVAMNMVALDVTDILGASIGDEVIILGDIDGIRGFDLCAQSGIRNVRELLARINPLLPRFVV